MTSSNQSDDKQKPEVEFKGKFLPKPLRVPPQLGAGNMGRKFQYLYTKHYVDVPIQESGSTRIERSYFWTGVRTEISFILQGDLNQRLGFLTLEQLLDLQAGVTPERETSITAAARNGLLYELSFSIAPQTGSSGVSPYGDLYTTSVVVSSDISLNVAADSIRKTVFKLGSTNASYVVVRGSIVQKKSKDTTWRYQL